MQPHSYPTMLTIAGSDPIAGAGIQADTKTATLLGVYALTVLTAVTAQNSCGVRQFLPLPQEILEAQLDAVLDELSPRAVKTGMIPSADSLRTIAGRLRRKEVTNLVVDPVLISSSGHSLCGDLTEYIPAAIRLLFPLATLITPNIPECAALLGISREEVLADTEAAARRLVELCGCGGVLLKGGHSDGATATDILCTAGQTWHFRMPRIHTSNDHGTGCILSSAIASFLALGLTLPEAVDQAKQFLSRRLELGRRFRLADSEERAGHGPLYLLPDNTDKL